ncbi:MAG: hypothetical protein N2596_08210 [Syntrophorhabdaceae bacterium]|nr:hypothetical protein [Syntrophorhabdaceae bacterium]
MNDQSNRTIESLNVLKLKEIVDYQEHAIVSREVIRKPSGTLTVFAFDKGEFK